MNIILGDGAKIDVVDVTQMTFKDACLEVVRLATGNYGWGHIVESNTGRIAATLAKTNDGTFRAVQAGGLAWRMDVPGAVVVRPLPAGAVISSWGAVAKVIEDHGNDHLVVDVGGVRQPWSWNFDGEPSQVVSMP